MRQPTIRVFARFAAFALLATPLLAKGGFYHAGQVCVSVQRVFASRGIAAALAERIATAARLLKIGDPTQPDTDVGPLIRPKRQGFNSLHLRERGSERHEMTVPAGLAVARGQFRYG